MAKTAKPETSLPGPDGNLVVPFPTEIISVQLGTPRNVLNLGTLTQVANTQAIITPATLNGVPGVRVDAMHVASYYEFIPMSALLAVRFKKGAE